MDPRARGDFQPLQRLPAESADLLIIRYSAHSAALMRVLERPEPKLVVYHNVTPPGYFWNHHVGVALACAVGRAQLPRFARAATVAAGDSEFNAAELRAAGAADARVLPILFDPRRLEPRGTPPAGDGPLVLVVSRLAPNKRHDLAIAAFAAWRAEHGVDARLVCVGEPVSPSYGELIAGLAASVDGGAVTLAGGLDQPDLNAAYAAADVMLSMSEHEGFSVPLLEAFHFGVPVVARPAGAMPEVGGDAVLWDRADDLAVTAELLQTRGVRPASCVRRWPSAGGRGWPSTSTRAPPSGSPRRWRMPCEDALAMSEEYDPDNLLDRNTSQATMEVHYEQVRRREAAILAARLGRDGRRRAVGGLRLEPGPAHVPRARVADDRAWSWRPPSPTRWWPTARWTPASPAGRERWASSRRPSTWCSTGWCCTTSPTRARWRRCSPRRRRCCGRAVR